MNLVDKEGEPMGNYSDYEYKGKIGKDHNKRENTLNTIRLLVLSIIFILASLLMLYLALFDKVSNDELFKCFISAIFSLCLAIYFFIKFKEYRKSHKILNNALDDYEKK